MSQLIRGVTRENCVFGSFSPFLEKKVGDEGAEVVGDGAGGFADAEAAGVLVDHPEAEDGVALGVGLQVVGEDDFGGEGLADLFAVVGTGGGEDGGGVADERDVGAFAGGEGFADVVAHAVRPIEVGLEEKLVMGVELPEDGEDAFVGEEHLPDGLDPAGAGVGGEGVGAELFG